MISLSNIRIGTKLAVISGTAILLVVGMIAIQWSGSSAIRGASVLSRNQVAVLTETLSTKTELQAMQVGVANVRLAADPEALQAALSYLDEQTKEVHQGLDALVQKALHPESKARFEKISGLIDTYLVSVNQITPLQRQIIELRAKRTAATGTDAANAFLQQIVGLQDEEAKIATDQVLPVKQQIDKLLDAALQFGQQVAATEQQNVDETLDSTELTALIAGIVTIGLLIGSALFSALSIARPLRALVGPLEDLAAGDFTVSIPGVGRKDEVGLIASAAGAVVERVGATIGNIKLAANEVTSASAEISTSTTDLSQRTEEQAASLEETSASMEQISATVKKNAENAQQANAFAAETSSVAQRGGAVVADAVTAMARIEDSSRKISDIITVIDEIARQTNLLALNAAVEAARAGEAGRGFAVVASEVRSLAQRSSQAAKDIKVLITNSNSQVKDGVDLVNKAGESLSEIVASIKKVATIVADIANASVEQSSGLEQVNKALAQMDEVTQQNSALVEENAATAKTLEQQAKSMDDRVASFRLQAQAARAGRGAAAVPAAEAEAGAETVRPAVPAKPAARQPAPKRVAAAAPKRAVNGSGGPVGRMQTALATAIQADDWKEF
jgi:methyl-accepting chemotaxis protein